MDNTTRDDKFFIGFDLGGTKMLALALDEDFKILGRKKRKTKGTDSSKDGLERITQTIEMAIVEAKLDVKNLQGIGIGCPGPINMDQGVVQTCPNLGWKNFAVGDLLKKHFHCPVSVLNDVDAGIYGEYRFGAAINSRCVVGIFPGTGIGGGCIYEGNILRGKKLSCMELGHMKISSGTRRGGIEMPGTLESEASRLSVASECVRLAYRGDAPNLLKLAGTDLSNVRSKTIAESIKKGDIEVEKLIRLSIEQIGYAAVNMVHFIAPDTLVLGGGLVESMPELYIEGVEKVLNKNVMDCYRGSCKVVAAKLRDDAGSLGAAAWAVSKMAPVAA